LPAAEKYVYFRGIELELKEVKGPRGREKRGEYQHAAEAVVEPRVKIRKKRRRKDRPVDCSGTSKVGGISEKSSRTMTAAQIRMFSEGKPNLRKGLKSGSREGDGRKILTLLRKEKSSTTHTSGLRERKFNRLGRNLDYNRREIERVAGTAGGRGNRKSKRNLGVGSR